MLSRDRRRVFFRCVGLALLLAKSLLSPSAALAVEKPGFVIFDGLLYRGKPEAKLHDMVPIAGVGDLWSPGASKDSVDAAWIRNLFTNVPDPNGYYYIDVENWPLLSVSDAVRTENIAKLTRVIGIARENAPQAHIGFYGLLPGITYWPLMHHERNYREWLQVNGQLQPLAAEVDAVFPSLYTFYGDLDGWKSYARQTLTEARRYGKPVYAFLWPEFHESNSALAGKPVPRAFWRAELELCAELADGVVLWGGWQQTWREDADWWQETLQFMDGIKSHTQSGNSSATDSAQHHGG